MNSLRLTWLFFFLWIVFPLKAGDDKDLTTKQQELQQLRNDIASFEEKIKSSEQREKNTLEMLDTYDRQNTLIKQLLRTLHRQEQKLADEIVDVQKNIEQLSAQVKYLQNQYSNKVVGAYKYGRLSDLELILSSRSLNQFAVRIEYLHRFSTQHKKDVSRLRLKQNQLEEKTVLLAKKLEEEHDIIAEKTEEEKTLQQKAEERTELLVAIRKDKHNFRHEIYRKTQAAKDLEKFITDLIEQEKIKKANEAAAAREKVAVAQPAETHAAFDVMQGKLRWPVSVKATIASRFGNQIHPQLKTVTQNTGVDISVPNGSDVLSVSEGEIVRISWLPSYGNLVIIDHGNGYRTVYTHLAEITVTTGDKVTEGQSIGTSGDSLNGPMVHFEVWHEREKLNPELWLAKR